MTDPKIGGKTEELPAQPPPTFPSTNLQVTPDGLLVQIMLAPGLVLQQGIGETMMNEVCKQWLQTRKGIKLQRDAQLAMIQKLSTSKLK